MLPPPSETEALYDGITGEHYGGRYAPLLVGGELSEAHAACLSMRPVDRAILPTICPHDGAQLAFVWMCPVTDNPLIAAPAVLPLMVHALDSGRIVQLHASSEAAIQTTRAAVGRLLGGGHA